MQQNTYCVIEVDEKNAPASAKQDAISRPGLVNLVTNRVGLSVTSSKATTSIAPVVCPSNRSIIWPYMLLKKRTALYFSMVSAHLCRIAIYMLVSPQAPDGDLIAQNYGAKSSFLFHPGTDVLDGTLPLPPTHQLPYAGPQPVTLWGFRCSGGNKSTFTTNDEAGAALMLKHHLVFNMSTDILAMHFRIPSRTFPVLPSSGNSSMFIDFLRGAGAFHANQDKIREFAHITALLPNEIAFNNSISYRGNIAAVQDAIAPDLFHLAMLCSVVGAFDSDIKIGKEDIIEVRTRLNKQLAPLPFSDDLISTFSPSEEGGGFWFRFDSYRYALCRAIVDFLSDEKAHLDPAHLYVMKFLFNKQAWKDRARANKAHMLDNNGKLINKNSVLGTGVFERMRAVELEDVKSRLFL